MGHDISGYLAGRRKKIAYLRRGAFNDLGRVIYSALNATDCDCGCSGCGTERTFSHEQLQQALGRVPAGDDTQPERDFLSNCIASGGPVTVTFY